MKFIILFAILIMTAMEGNSQNLVGYTDHEIRNFMKENRKDLNFERVTNTKFMYLKYTDNNDNQTLLFFLNPDSVCKSIRIICDQSIKPDKVKEFNSIYRKNSKNKWIDRHDNKSYLIEMKDDKWACIITIEPVK